MPKTKNIEDLEHTIATLQNELEWTKAEVIKYKILYDQAHNQLLGTLHAIQAITKPGEPRLFKAG